MHGKNSGNFGGTDITIFNYIDKPIECEKFGFDILFEEHDVLSNDKNNVGYEEGEITKRFVEDFSDNTIICRSILDYWTNSKNDKFFTSWHITKNWLIENCLYFKNKYQGKLNKTNIPNKVDKNKDHVSILLERLTYLSLLESRYTESKNHISTTEYRYTELGKLVALLLKYDENFYDKNSVEEIYNQTLKFYTNQNYSFALFCMLFFSNCYKMDPRLFGIVIISNLLYILKEPPNDKDSVLNKLRNFPINYDSEALFVILVNSLNEFKALFPEEYNKVIYNLKLGIESETEKNCKNLSSFEKQRYDNNGLHSVVLEGYCNACRKYTPIPTPSMFLYFKASIKNKYNKISMNCPNLNCNGENTYSFEA
jgi:hypothetical protein